ncbi:MAG: hypothetical protein ACM3Z4_06545 [Hyphomicrobiales bacterium]
MMSSLSSLDDENLLTYEVPDEALETAGGNEIAGNYTLGACSGLSVCPAGSGRQINSKDWRHPVSNHFLNWTSRVAIAGRIAECRRPQNWNELTIIGDYHLPFGKAEAQAKVSGWLWQSCII